jgi:hypothetical protein
LGFDGAHRALSEFDASVIECGDQFDNGMMAVVGHIGSEIEYGVHGIQQSAVPVVFQNAPTTFNRIVLAVVRGIVGQVDGELIPDSKSHEASHKLSPSAVVFGTIIQIENQGIDMGQAVTDTQPPVFEAVDQTIGGDFRGHHIQKQVVKLGEKNPDGRERSTGFEVVIGGLDRNPTFSPPRERTDFDGGFGIHGETQNVLSSISGLIGPGHLLEDRIGFGNLFWGFDLATFLG